MVKYKSKLQKYWDLGYRIKNNKYMTAFDKNLEDFIGYVMRKTKYNFNQTTSEYFDLRANIKVYIVEKLMSGHYEECIEKNRMKQLIKNNELEKKLEILNQEDLTYKNKNQLLNKLIKKGFTFDGLCIVFSNFIINKETKILDFRTYIYTQIRGEFTKFFNKHDKYEGTDVELEIANEIPFELDYLKIELKKNIEEYILKYGLVFSYIELPFDYFICNNDLIEMNKFDLINLKFLAWLLYKKYNIYRNSKI